jgi:hypothetical protein
MLDTKITLKFALTNLEGAISMLKRLAFKFHHPVLQDRTVQMPTGRNVATSTEQFESM